MKNSARARTHDLPHPNFITSNEFHTLLARPLEGRTILTRYGGRGGYGGGGESASGRNQGIEAQKIWNLGSKKISGIWDLGVLEKNVLTEYCFLQLHVGPKISKHKSILQMDPQRQDGPGPLP